jgi:hypothetical protein
MADHIKEGREARMKKEEGKVFTIKVIFFRSIFLKQHFGRAKNPVLHVQKKVLWWQGHI